MRLTSLLQISVSFRWSWQIWSHCRKHWSQHQERERNNTIVCLDCLALPPVVRSRSRNQEAIFGPPIITLKTFYMRPIDSPSSSKHFKSIWRVGCSSMAERSSQDVIFTRCCRDVEVGLNSHPIEGLARAHLYAKTSIIIDFSGPLWAPAIFLTQKGLIEKPKRRRKDDVSR